MTNKLEKPYTTDQYAEFAHQANENNKILQEFDNAIWAVNPYEKVTADGIVYLEEDYLNAQKELRVAEIKNSLDALDLKTVRCLRTIASSSGEELTTEKTFLENLEEQACQLRTELAELS